MLSEQDKEDMLADAASVSRRESFRRLKMLQSARRPSLEEYCAFCESVAGVSPQRPRPSLISGSGLASGRESKMLL